MLDEFRGDQFTLEDVHKKLSDKIFVKDYFDQCLAGIGAFKYADDLRARPHKFDIYAGSSLNPLSPEGKCQGPGCVIEYAHQFARTACLYADRVALPDPFSFSYLEATDGEILWCLNVLKVLRPLLDAGVIVFSPGAYTSCGYCAKAIEDEEERVASQLWHEFTRSSPDVFRFKYGRRWRLSFGSALFKNAGAEIRITTPATREAIAATKPDTLLTGKNASNLIRQYSERLKGHFARCAHNVVFDSMSGNRCNTTVVTGTREESVGYRLLDRRELRTTSPEGATLRTIPLPALQRLTASQAMQVREEAQKALPSFRAKLQRDLMSLDEVSDEAEEKRALEVAAELRLAARELESQLAAIRLPSLRRRDNLFAGLAMAIELVGLSTGNAAAVIAASSGFAALMFAAHQSERGRQEKHEALVHQPAYVLLTAERIHARMH